MLSAAIHGSKRLSPRSPRSSVTGKSSSELKFEIGHVLFIDLVGSTQLTSTREPHEVAEVLNVPIGTVRSRIARGRALLKEALS